MKPTEALDIVCALPSVMESLTEVVQYVVILSISLIYYLAWS